MLGGPGAPRYPVTEQVQLIGRSERSEIALFEPTVSRRHASVCERDGQIVLEDLDSKHGTFVNSKRIQGPSVVKVGDIVVFGLSLVLRVEQTDQPLPPVEPLRVPSDPPGALDEQYVTAVRDSSLLRRDEVPPPAAGPPPELPAADLQRCLELIPEAHVRVRELRDAMQRAMDDGRVQVDPYPVLTSLESALQVMDELLELSRGPAPSPCSLRELTESAIDALPARFADRGVIFLFEIPDPMEVVFPRAELRRALALVLSQAGDASSDDSPVELMAVDGEDGHVRLTVSHLGQEMLDQGTGSAYDQARAIVAARGGRVLVESRPSIGATVRITLPGAGR